MSRGGWSYPAGIDLAVARAGPVVLDALLKETGDASVCRTQERSRTLCRVQLGTVSSKSRVVAPPQALHPAGCIRAVNAPAHGNSNHTELCNLSGLTSPRLFCVVKHSKTNG